ncbi:unnamed protein product [Rotaria magnacalcarata]
MNKSKAAKKNGDKQSSTVSMNNPSQGESSNHSERLTVCPNCGVHLTETAIIEHLKYCQKLTHTFQARDGTVTSMSYADRDQIHRITLKPVPDNLIPHVHHGQSFQQTRMAPRSEHHDYKAPLSNNLKNEIFLLRIMTRKFSTEMLPLIYIQVNQEKFARVRLTHASTAAQLRTILLEDHQLSSDAYFLDTIGYRVSEEDESKETIKQLLCENDIIYLRNEKILLVQNASPALQIRRDK